jgi:hypothetical protein
MNGEDSQMPSICRGRDCGAVPPAAADFGGYFPIQVAVCQRVLAIAFRGGAASVAPAHRILHRSCDGDGPFGVVDTLPSRSLMGW